MKLDSITPRILFALISTTVLCLGSYFIYNYISLENNYSTQLQKERNIAGRQASKNLAIPLYTFDDRQAMQVIESLMINPNITNITVRDDFLPAQSHLSFSRNATGDVVATTNQVEAGTLLDIHQIAHNGKSIGAVEIHFTDRHIKEALHEAVISNLSALVFLTVVLSLAIFFMLRRTVIEPLSKLEGLALSIDKDGNSDAPFDATPFVKEIRHVHRAMISTLSLLRIRIKELSESQQALRHSEKLLQQAQKMEAIGRLAGGIAHDFNNVLSGIIGYTEIMLVNEPEGTTRKNQLQQVLSGGKRARDLVKQILTFSHNSQAEKQPFKLRELVEETLNLLRVSVPVVIDIQKELADNCGMVLADSTQFHQVLMNIFTNGSHAMEKTGGVLTITVRPVEKLPEKLRETNLDCRNSFAEITISDTGTGIDEKILDRIFDPFFTTKEKGKGTGMGLSVVYGIIKDMKGAILVDSQLGVGTVFTIYLPTIQPGDHIQTSQSERKIQHHEGTIMVVDDEKLVVDVLKAMLEQLGYTVRTFTRSFDAIEEFSTHPADYDLIITDYAMPGINGIELVDQVMKVSHTIPILLCTGFSDKIDSKLAKSHGVKAFVYKPIDRAHLSELVSRLLERE